MRGQIMRKYNEKNKIQKTFVYFVEQSGERPKKIIYKKKNQYKEIQQQNQHQQLVALSYDASSRFRTSITKEMVTTFLKADS